MKVSRRIPIGSLVSVTLIVSSISVYKISFLEPSFRGISHKPEMIPQPSGSA